MQLNVLENFSARLPDAYRSSPFVMLGAIQPSLQLRVIEQLSDRSRSFILADTFDLWIHTTKPELERMLRLIDLFVINEDESPLLLTRGPRPGPLRRRLLQQDGIADRGDQEGRTRIDAFPSQWLFAAISAYPVATTSSSTSDWERAISYAGALIGYLKLGERHRFR